MTNQWPIPIPKARYGDMPANRAKVTIRSRIKAAWDKSAKQPTNALSYPIELLT